MRNVYQTTPVSRRTRLLARTALSGALLGLAAPAAAQSVPWIQSYYGGTGGAAPTFSSAAGINTVTLNAPRTIIDWDDPLVDSNVSGFAPSDGNAYDFRFQQRDWTAIVRTGRQIIVDGNVRTLLPNDTIGGNLWLLGGGGVLFTGNARVDVGGLLATPANLTNDNDFLNGQLSSRFFTQGAAQDSSVELYYGAQVTGHGGTLSFIAPHVRTNAGDGDARITGLGGTSILYGAARNYTVSFAREAGGDFDLLSFEVDFPNDGGVDDTNNGYGYAELMSLRGITTTDGNIYVAGAGAKNVATAVISARGTMTATNASAEGGNIILSAGGSITNRAISSTTGTGRVTLDVGEVITGDRNGTTSGGDIRIQATGSVTGTSLISAKDTIVRAGRTTAEISTAGSGYGNVVTDSGARGGGIQLETVTSYGDLLLDAVNGQERNSNRNIEEFGIDLIGVRLAGMTGTATSPLDFNTASENGNRLLIRTRISGTPLQYSSQRINIGGPGGVRGQLAGELTTRGYSQLTGAGGVQVDVMGDVALNSVLSGGQATAYTNAPNIDVRTHSGSVTVGDATNSGGNVLIEASTTVSVGSAKATLGLEETGVLSVHGGTSATLTTGTAAGDVYVVADGGNATAGTVTAGDDIYVRATNGAARLTTGIIDNSNATGTPGAADIYGGAELGYEGGDVIPGFDSDSEENGRVIQVQASGVGADAYLGLGTGGVGLAKADLSTSVNVYAGRNIFVNGATQSGLEVNITDMEAGANASVIGNSGNVHVGSLSAGGDAEIKALAGNLQVGYADASQDSQAAQNLLTLFASGDIDANYLSSADRISVTAGGNIRARSLSAYGTLNVDAALDAELVDVSGNDGVTLRAGGQVTHGKNYNDGYGYVGYLDSYYGPISLTGNFIVLHRPVYADGGDLTLTAPGGMTAFESLNAGGNISITAGASGFHSDVTAHGSLTGTFTGATTFDYVAAVEQYAAFAITEAPTAANSLSLTTTAGNLTIGGASADGDLVLKSAGTLNLSEYYAGHNLSLTAATLAPLNINQVNGALHIDITGGGFSYGQLLEATGDIDIRAAGALTLVNGNTSENSLTAGGSLTLLGTGAVQLGTFSTGANASITGQTLTLAAIPTIPGSLALKSTGGGFSFANAITAGTDLTIDATGNVTVGTLQAGDDIKVRGAAITVANAKTTNSNTNDSDGANVTIEGTGAVQLTSHNSAADLNITGQTITLGGTFAPVARSLALNVTGGNFTYASQLQAGTDLTVQATGNVTLGTVRAGDDIRISGQTLTLADLRTSGTLLNDTQGANVTLSGSAINVGTLAAFDDVQATATGALALATASGGTLGAGRDIRLSGGTLTLPATIAGARDLSIARTAGNFDAGSGYSAARDLTLSSNAELTVGAASAGRDLRLLGSKVTLASLMTTRDLSVSAGSGGVTATTAVNPGRDLTVNTSGDATFTTVTAGDDIRVTAGGKVTATSLTSNSGTDSESDGRNVFVTGTSTAIGSATAPNTVSITPAPPSAPTPTPTPPVTPTPTPTPPPNPWAQASYGGVVNGTGAATSTSSASMIDITLNSQRTLLDFGATNGISDFRPTAAQGVTFHYGDRSWIAVVRSTGQIQVDGALRTVLGDTDTIGGNLWLLSNAGVLFGANARVDVGGLMANASGIANIADALDPARSSFTFDSAGTGGIVIQSGAQVRATGGALVFVGPSVTSAAGSTVTGTNGASLLYAATGPATVSYTRAANGDLIFASANGSFASGAVDVAGTTSVDGSATIGGTSVNVGTLNTGGAVTMLATSGNVSVGTMASQGAATFDASNKVILGDVSATDVRVVAADLDVNTRLAGRALQVESRVGDMTLGGDGTAAGFVVGKADFSRVAMTGGAAFYAGQLASQSGQAAEGTKRAQATPARGSLTITDLDLDPTKMPTIGLYADNAHTVAVVGAVKPTITGGIVQIGDAMAAAEWKPSAIAISGGFGSAIVYNEKCFDQVISLAELRLNAVGNIVFGDAAFQTAVASTAAASIDVARGTPASGTGTDRIFAVTQKLTIGAGGKVVQQNTAKTNGAAIGLILANQDTGTDTVLSVSGGPTALDLFGSIIDQSGTLRSGINAAAAAELKVSGGVKANFRFNGCALASAASCSKLDTSAVSSVKGSTGLMREVAEDDSAPVGGN